MTSIQKYSLQSMNYIKQIADSIPVGVIEINLDGKIQYINFTFSQLLGYAPQEILNDNLSPHVYDDFSVLNISKSIDNFPENTCPVLTFISKEKELIKLNIRWSKVFNEDKELIGICAAATTASNFYSDDNNEKKENELFETRLLIRNSKLAATNENLRIKLKEKDQIQTTLLQSEDKFGSIFEFAPNAIIVTRDSGKIFMANTAAVKMFGYDKNEFNTKSIDHIISDTDDSGMCGITSTGKRFPVIVNLVQIEILGMFCIGAFITPGIKTEEKSSDIPDIEKYIQLSKVVEQTDDLVSITNENGIFEYVNPSFEKFTGYTTDEVLGKSSNILRSGKHDNQFYKELWETVKLGKVFNAEFYNKKKSGEIYIEEKTISPIKDVSGNILHYVSTGSDITERKKNEEQLLTYKNHLEELVEKRTKDYKQVQSELIKEVGWRKEAEEELRVKEERLHLAIEAAEEGLWDLNLETNKIYSNEIFQKMIGIVKPQDDGLNLNTYQDFIYENDREKYQEEFEKHLNNNTPGFSFEHRIKDANGNIKWVASKGKVVLRDDNNNPLRFIGKLEDISLRKKSEVLFRKAFHKAKELTNIKSRFVSMVSHEFRTPLATVLSSTEILEQYYNQISESERNDYFKKIGNSIEYLSSMLNDVITINKGELNKIGVNIEEFDVVEFCRQIIADIKLNHIAANIVFVSDLEINYIKSDKKALTQIISNLLSNAVKYNINENEIKFTISFDKELMIMKFRDHGIGISSNDQQGLFGLFFRGSNVSNIPGSGLGLAIVKKSVEILKGKIIVKSKINSGAMFIVKIPGIIVS